MPELLYVGIDPGVSAGAIAALDQTGDLVDVRKLPTLKFGTTKKTRAGNPRTRTEYDEMAIIEHLEWLQGHARIDVAVVERSTSRPVGESNFSAHTNGISYRILCGLLSALRIPNERPYPATWKALVMAGQPKHKEASVPSAQRMWPAHAQRFRGPKGAALDGYADAALLAEYGRRLRSGVGRGG